MCPRIGKSGRNEEMLAGHKAQAFGDQPIPAARDEIISDATA
jgi:hypothetical protein